MVLKIWVNFLMIKVYIILKNEYLILIWYSTVANFEIRVRITEADVSIMRVVQNVLDNAWNNMGYNFDSWRATTTIHKHILYILNITPSV